MSPLESTDRGYLEDILVYGERARRHLGTMSPEQFKADEKTQDSVVRCLEIIGEAAWKMSNALKIA